jgi:putative transposase
MPFRKHMPEEIIGKLREAEIVLAQGASAADACRGIAVSEQTFGSRHAPGMAALPQYRWRKKYGGLKTDQARRMKDLEKENGRLRRAISDLTLDKLILQDEEAQMIRGIIENRTHGETSEPRAAAALH